MSCVKGMQCVIVYASQTGQSQAIAESINDMLVENGFKPELYSVKENDQAFKLNELTIPMVFISSTTGDGEPPETGLKLWNKLKRLAHDEKNKNYLQNLNYAILGLGDSNYAQFCNGPKLFHNKFKELGAKCFYGPFWADDGVGLELEVEPFKDGLIDALNEFYLNKDIVNVESDKINLPHITYDLTLLTDKLNDLKLTLITNEELATAEISVPLFGESHMIIEFNNNEPIELQHLLSKIYPAKIFKAKVIENKLITSKGSVKDCYNLKFTAQVLNLNDDMEVHSLFKYEPGYSLDIITPNNKNEVYSLLERIGIEKNQFGQIITLKSNDTTKKTGSNFIKITDATKITLEMFFIYCVDIRNDGLKKSLLRMLAEYTQNDKQKRRLLELCSKEGNAQYQSIIKDSQMSLLDLLNIFESCKPPLAHLIQLLPPLTCRPYSLCSSIASKELEVVYNLVKFDEKQNTYSRNGVGTGYLSKLVSNNTFYFCERSMQNFVLPDDYLNKNILMFGPGTGIAPFIGFLRHLDYLKHNSVNGCVWWLFYGCRHPNKDFLFKNELYNLLAKNNIAKLSVSYSRYDEDRNNNEELFYEENCKYITDLIKLKKKEIAELIYQKEAIVYVCGDANNMSKDIMNALNECLSTESGMTMEEAQAYLFNMMKLKRYRQEIWA